MSYFEQISPLLIDPAIAEALSAGGPAPETTVRAGAAQRLARAWIASLHGGRVDEAVALYSRTAWSGWSGCEVRDRTWVIGMAPPATPGCSV